MQQRIKEFLGITALQDNFINRIRHLEGEVWQLTIDLRIQNRAIAMLIAKVDPSFIVSEDDPARKAASDALGEAAIKRIKGEFFTSNPTIQR